MAWKNSFVALLSLSAFCCSGQLLSATPSEVDVTPLETAGALIDIVKTITRVPTHRESTDCDRGSTWEDTIYSITVRNSGRQKAAENSMFLIDQLPRDHIFFNDQDMSSVDGKHHYGAAIRFEGKNSGLDFDVQRDVAFSSKVTMPGGFDECDYHPIAGYDPKVRHICLNPKGAFAAGNPISEFTIRLRTKVMKPRG